MNEHRSAAGPLRQEGARPCDVDGPARTGAVARLVIGAGVLLYYRRSGRGTDPEREN